MLRLPPLLTAAVVLSPIAVSPQAPIFRPGPSTAPWFRGSPQSELQEAVTRAERVKRLLRTLAHDSMEGRRTGSDGAARAARFLAAELERYGVEPAGDDGYYQHVPLLRATTEGERPGRLSLAPEGSDPDTLDTMPAKNVVGVIRGTDHELAEEAVVVGAHFDRLGVGRPVEGDSIYNGADDDASGTVAVLEIARALAQGEAPGRTVIILLTTGEEMGLLGTRWYMRHPVVSLERTVADLQIEMIGRPDSLAGGRGHGWLTGYERSTMGDLLRERGSPIVPDPRPDQRFFFRSDNIAFAMAGIPAHTLSSFNLHDDYHRPTDEADEVDFEHMTAVIEAAVAMVRGLAHGARPRWHEGGRPEPSGGP